MSLSAIIGLLSSIVAMFVKFLDWLHEQKLVESGKAQQQLDDLKGQIDGIKVAIAAREAVRRDIATSGPNVVPNDDPFIRD